VIWQVVYIHDVHAYAAVTATILDNSVDHRFFRLALVLGLISAVGPFSIDMYLPALPSIGAGLKASPAAVQMTLTVFFGTLGVCQLFYGPLSDHFGRKPPIFLGLALFGIGSVGCALAPTIESLIAFRMVEALGACAGMVIPRAIVRDLHTGPEAASLMSLLILVFSISPICAPMTGSFVIAFVGWRGIFWTVTAVSALCLVLAATLLEETWPKVAHVANPMQNTLNSFRRLLSDPTFLGLTFVGAFSMSAFFIYLASSSFVYIDHYGLSPATYSLLFGFNAISLFGVAQLNGGLTRRFGMAKVIRIGATGFALVMIVLLAVVAMHIEQLGILVGLLFVGFGFTGLIVPTTAVLALEKHGATAGTASALMGALQMITGAVIMEIVGVFANDTPLPMVAGIAACALIAFGLVQSILLSSVSTHETKPAS
jgi:DHA1 family bicyclomycin/chloramphenicol resistance-like MFS transporter